MECIHDELFRFNTFADAAGLGFGVGDLDGRIVHVNPTLCRLMGEEQPQDVIGKYFMAYYPAGWKEKRAREVLPAMERDGYWKGELVLQSRQGTLTPTLHHVFLLRDADGRPVRRCVVVSDITPIKQAQESLRRSEEHYRVLSETMLQGVVHQDDQGTIIAMNPAAARILGKMPEEMLGDSSTGVEHHTIREDGSLFPGLEHPSMVALRTGQPVRGVVMGVFNPRAGGYRWISIDAVPLFRPDEPRPYQVYTVFEDITQRKRADDALKEAHDTLEQRVEERTRELTRFNEVLRREVEHRRRVEKRLRQSEQRYSALFANKINAIAHCKVITDEHGKPVDYCILEVNGAYEQIIGIKKADIEGRRVTEVFPGVEGFATDFIGILGRIALEGGEITFEGFLETTGQHLSIYAYRSAPGEFTTIFTDTTQRKRAEEALRRSEERLRLAAEGARFGTYTYDFETGVGVWSPELMALWGLEPDCPVELDADKLYKGLYPDDRALFLAAMTAANDPAGSGVIDLDYRVLWPDGSVRWLHVHGLTEFVGAGKSRRPRRAAGAAIDITARKRAEEALLKSEERHRTILQTAIDGFWLVDLGGRLLEVNDAYCQMSGYGKRELLDMRIADLEAVEADDDIAARIQSIAREGHQRFESRHRRKDGSVFDVDVSVQYRADDGGRIVAFFRDITRRKQAEQALRDSEALHRAFFESPGALRGVVEVVDDDILHLADNDSSAAFFGTTAQAMRNGRASDMGVPREVVRQWIEHYQASRQAGRPVVFEYTHPSTSGELWLRATVSHVGLSPAQRDRYVYVVHDITHAKRDERSLRESEERLRLAAEAANFGTYDVDLCTGVKHWSHQARVILGYGADEACHHNDDRTPRLIHPEDRASLAAAIAAACDPRGNGTLAADHRIALPDGTVRWVQVLGRAFFEGQGGARRPVRATGTLLDITDRKRAAQHELELERQLLHAQKLESIGVLAGGIAHDFNNILAGIMGYAELARLRLPESEPARKDIDVITQCTRRAADLTRQMLAYAGKGKFVVEPVSLSRIVDDNKKMLAISVSKKATVTYDLAQDLPAILADASQVQQILLNLVINASDALGDDNGAIAISTDTLRLSAADCAAPGEATGLREGLHVRLQVRDTGCGMDEPTLAKAFDPFFTTKFTGRGLGLSAVHGIVRSHKGGIRVSSRPGGGTTFVVLFPVIEMPAIQPPDGAIADRPWRGSGTVLVVDDEEVIRNVAGQMLEHLGFVVLTAADGEEAIRLYSQRADEIVCVLLDLTMPKMNGEETFRELRRISPQVRVILSSGYSETAATERFSGMGLAGFMSKPYQLDTMAAKLREAVGT